MSGERSALLDDADSSNAMSAVFSTAEPEGPFAASLLTQVMQRLDRFSDHFDRVEQGMSETPAMLKEVKQSMSELSHRVEQGLSEMSGKVEEVKQGVSELSDKVEKGTSEMSGKVEAMSCRFEGVEKGTSMLFDRFDGTERELANLGDKVDSASRRLSDIEGAVGEISTTMVTPELLNAAMDNMQAAISAKIDEAAARNRPLPMLKFLCGSVFAFVIVVIIVLFAFNQNLWAWTLIIVLFVAVCNIVGQYFHQVNPWTWF